MKIILNLYDHGEFMHGKYYQGAVSQRGVIGL